MCEITQRTSGKIILSGEHSVVYGSPAIVMAVDKFAVAKLKENSQNSISIILKDIGTEINISMEEILSFFELSKQKYELFLEEKLEIKEVLNDKTDIVKIVIAKVLTQFEVDIKNGFSLEVFSELPIASGMGSSTAVISSVLKCVTLFHDIHLDQQSIYDLTQDIEKFHAGKPSGVDAYISSYRGTAKFENGKGEAHKEFCLPYILVDTGKPEATTGEVVMDVSSRLKESLIWNDFRNVTLDFSYAIKSKDENLQKEVIRKNHNLLVEIGVVPSKVQEFISEIEQNGNSAKISGAGSHIGDNAGIVLVVGQENCDDIIKKYGYRTI